MEHLPASPVPYSVPDLLRWPRWKVWLKGFLVATGLAGAALRWWRARRPSPAPKRPLSPPGGRAFRLNLGCGESHYQGYLHADLVWHPHLNFQADGRALPLRDGCLEELLATELLEHLDEEGGRQLLAEAARTLAPGGYLILTTPALDLLCRAWRAGIPTHRQMLQHLYGRSARPSDPLHSGDGGGAVPGSRARRAPAHLLLGASLGARPRPGPEAA